MKKSGLLFFLLAVAVSNTVFGQVGTSDVDAGKPGELQFSKVKVDTLYTEFKNPWGMAWLTDGRMLVTERAGEILVFQNDQFTGIKLKGVPEVFSDGQGGLLDIKTHPDYAKNGWIYITYSKPVEGGATTAIMRFKLKGNELVDKQEIYTAKTLH